MGFWPKSWAFCKNKTGNKKMSIETINLWWLGFEVVGLSLLLALISTNARVFRKKGVTGDTVRFNGSSCAIEPVRVLTTSKHVLFVYSDRHESLILR